MHVAKGLGAVGQGHQVGVGSCLPAVSGRLHQGQALLAEQGGKVLALLARHLWRVEAGRCAAGGLV